MTSDAIIVQFKWLKDTINYFLPINTNDIELLEIPAKGKVDKTEEVEVNQPPKPESFSCNVIGLQVLMFIFTEWPWETVLKTVEFATNTKNTPQEKQQKLTLANSPQEERQQPSSNSSQEEQQHSSSNSSQEEPQQSSLNSSPEEQQQSSSNSSQEEQQPSSTKCSFKWIIWTLLRLLFVLGGLAL